MAAGGVCLLTFVTRTGLALKPDSVTYLGGANSLAHGHGYTIVSAKGLRHAKCQPAPLYSLLLAGLELVGFDLLDAARGLNLVLFGTTAVLVYALLLRTSRGSRASASLGTAAFIVAPAVLPRFAFALSEPLFLFLVAATMMLLLEYLRRDARWVLAGATVTSALAGVTRNVGVATVGVGAVVLLLLGFGDRGARRRAAALFATIAIGPFLVWTVWSPRQPEPGTRSLGVHFVFQRLQNGYGVMAQWVFPSRSHRPPE